MIKYSALVALALLPTGCPLLDVQTDVQDACLSYKDVHVEAAPAGETSFHQMFAFDDLGPIHDLLAIDDGAEVHFVSAKLTATTGISDFTFIQSANLTLSTETQPALDVYRCDGDCLGADNTLAIPTTVQDNALDYLRGDSVAVDMAFEGELPTTAWTMDVDMCFSAKAGYSL